MDRKKSGLFIAQLRNKKNLNQEQLAQKLHVDRSVISKWESGKNIPTPEMLMTLSKFFNVSVNEILLGEKLNKDNENQINEVTVTVIKDTQTKIKKITWFSTITVFALILIFFIYYFFNTYNTIKVYKLTGESDSFYINDGVMIISKEKVYINIANIRTIGTAKANEYTLYYLKDNKKIILDKKDITKPLLFKNEYNSKNSIFVEEDIKYIIDNLYLDINRESINISPYIETIHLNIKKDFANSKIIFH